jgi:hypothetical protein
MVIAVISAWFSRLVSADCELWAYSMLCSVLGCFGLLIWLFNGSVFFPWLSKVSCCLLAARWAFWVFVFSCG